MITLICYIINIYFIFYYKDKNINHINMLRNITYKNIKYINNIKYNKFILNYKLIIIK